MATQGGMKHAATTPSHLDTKRESTSRRRVGTGPAGRTSVLRRAPSDSDCSGETASLSADSADRVRPMPPTTRQAKTRSRRRGSEWEVLEGLKDGQRFERRPEVFNGYLHKKRKWPLKGWHKRFFVVDGGILVYARSPTDVARGRLHGSVDVGLSVISAKARRRRIDIDADEFIYHLRAKTPDVFRTWLNVLKAHRLYRQHLLTFGARESAPKIHAPLDDLPPTEASSPMSYSSVESLSPDNSKTLLLDILKAPKSAPFKTNVPCYNNAPIYCKSNQNHISNWFFESADNAELVPLHFEPLEDNNIDVNVDNDDGNTDLYNHSLCSMNCVAKRYQKYFEEVKPPHVESSGITENETQINHTDLGRNSPDTFCSSKFSNYPFNKDMVKPVFPAIYEPFRPVRPKAEKHIQPNTGIVNRVTEPTTALFLFSKKKRTTPRSSSLDTPMKRSKKSTNVVKYKNVADEPPLKKPISKGMLLSKYHNKSTAQSNHSCEVIFDNDIRTADAIEDKSPNLPPPTEFDKNIEILIMSILGSKEGIANCVTIKDYVDEMVKEINNLKLAQSEIHPVKILLKYLLEYWLKNALPNSESVSSKVQSRTIQTNHCKTRDKNISSVLISCEHKHTQFHDSESILDFLPKSQPFTCSYLKDRQIQELERVLKNTVYTFENANYNQSKIKDIETTKKLINNLDKRTKNPQEFKKIHSDSSMEFPEIQETFNNLIKDTSLSADVAKEFLGAYLDVLQNDSDKTSSLSTDDSKGDERDPPHCQVQAESIVKTMSKEVLTSGKDDNEKVCQVRQVMVDSGQDSGQVYLKGVLDKLTTIFTKADEKENERINAVKENFSKKIKGFDSDMIKEDLENNSVVVDLTKYDVENVSLLSDPVMKGAMSITVKLKQRLPNLNLAQTQKEISMKLSEDIPNIVTSTNSPEMINPLDSNVLYKNQLSNFNNSFIDYELNGHKDKIELRPFMSSSDATSKGYKTMYDNQSDRTLCSPKASKEKFMKRKSMEGHEDLQSYFVLSNLKKNLSSVFQPKKKVRVQDTKDTTIYPSRESSTCCMKCGECSGSQKSVPTAIDEHFILLLLENLTLLSLNMPSMHKEISNLFGRLKKKIEKDRRINRAGVGLLGQIYQSRLVENETQYDTETATKKSDSATKLIHKNINTDLEETNNAKIDKITSMVVVNTVLKDFNAQADERLLQKYNVEVAGTAFKKSNFEALGCKTGPSTKAESKRNWMEAIHKDNALSNIIKCLIENSSSCQNFRFVSKDDPRLRTRDKHVINKGSCQSFKIIYCEKDLGEKTERPKWQNVRQDHQGSSHMCENKMKKLLKDLKLKRDYNVYQLFMSNKFRMSGSLSGSNIVVQELSDDLKTIYRCTSEPSYCSGLLSPVSPPLRGPQAGFVAGTPGGRLASWIIESGGPLENATRELGQASLSVQQLQRLLDALELQQHQHDTDQMSLEGASPNVKKDRRKFGLRKKKSNSKCASVELAPPHHVDASASHMALSALTAPPSPGGGASSMPSSAASLPIACAAARPQSLPGTEVLAVGVGPASLSSLTPDQQLREDFTVLAKDLLATLKGVVSTLVCERGRLRAAMESGEGGAGGAAGAGGGAVAALRTNLSSALQQNSELRSRLSRIHDASDLAEISSVNNSDPVCRQFPQSLSYSSSCVSASEFFDAEEHDPPADLLPADETGVIELDGDSSSDAGSLSSEDGSDASAGSDNSEGALAPAEPSSLTLNQNGVEESGWTRRTRLPCPRPTPGGPSLWNLLYKNIGKDLSQVSMPVTINEPLNMLQRLCEELEYSGLLDTAAACSGAAERLCLVAAFAVSAYAATAHRAASKPFNPLLQESYECVRPDRGFHFLAEQVSHHPPISACHAESPNWCFWQEARIKTKFWGKSMEFQPAGRVHVRLLPNGDHYSWNKVTTCVHNLFGGQRWVDQYGDMHIVCHDNDMSCKLQFIKASSWSSSRHEVRGWVSGGGGPRLRLHGRWSEALYAGDPPAARCLWRPGAMPPDNDLYYGFTRFAMELNEMEPGLRELLPHTDTRLRPDQRALEEGAVDAAEQYKHDLEQAQRDRRRDQPDPPPAWFRKSAEGGEEMWVFTGEYWKARSAGFPAADGRAPRLW